MEQRVNSGYVITDSIHVGDVEFVIGENPAAPSPFVTWECKNGSNYYWGHYSGDRLTAVCDLLERAGQELDYQKQLKERAGKAPEKPPKEKKERER